MTIEQKICMMIEATPKVVSFVLSGNIHLQANDESENNYTTVSPMITYAEVSTSYSVAKIHWMYQVTVWSKDKLQANDIAEDIRSQFDRVRDTEYNFSWITWRTPIYDYTEKMHWTALNLNIVKRKL